MRWRRKRGRRARSFCSGAHEPSVRSQAACRSASAWHAKWGTREESRVESRESRVRVEGRDKGTEPPVGRWLPNPRLWTLDSRHYHFPYTLVSKVSTSLDL